MKKVIALFCTAFVLLSSGYAQSNRVGIYLTPQYCFFNQKGIFDKSVKGKGFIFNGGAYYEKNWGLYGFSVGVGYTQLNTHFATDSVERTHKKGLVTIPIGGAYDFGITDNIFVGIHGTVGFSYLISEKQFDAGIETDMEAGKKLYCSFGGGLSFTYLFTDAIGLSVKPIFSVMSVFDPAAPTYLGVGAQIQFFYAFGY